MHRFARRVYRPWMGRLRSTGFRTHSARLFSRFALTASLPLGAAMYYQQHAQLQDVDRESLPVIALSEVEKHNHMKVGFWVTYKGLVYDITDFISAHPGGSSKIIMAAGSDLEPFWHIYRIHTKTPEVAEILRKHLIGRLSTEDEKQNNQDIAEETEDNPYANEPSRHPVIHKYHHTVDPYNAESPIPLLTDNFLTPNQFFYVRHHFPVPDIDPEEFRLQVAGMGVNAREYTLEELKTLFEPVTLTVTLQCAGNRRGLLNSISKTQGLGWNVGAISTATWTGARLKDVLAHAGFERRNNPECKHVWFTGADGGDFDASVPLNKALSGDGDVILAYQMNGEDIPRDHGYPLRNIVPGHLGARSVKWCEAITTSDEESPSTYQSGIPYRSMPSYVTSLKGVNPADYMAVQELPVQSAICSPEPGQHVSLENGELVVKGYAFSGGGTGVNRVDVSADGGKHWLPATIHPPPKDAVDDEHDKLSNRCWAWRLWEAHIPSDSLTSVSSTTPNAYNLCVRAVDTHNNAQPGRMDEVWSVRGILNNSWHRVDFKLDKQEDKSK